MVSPVGAFLFYHIFATYLPLFAGNLQNGLLILEYGFSAFHKARERSLASILLSI
jgi:hypothetical protein